MAADELLRQRLPSSTKVSNGSAADGEGSSCSVVGNGGSEPATLAVTEVAATDSSAELLPPAPRLNTLAVGEVDDGAEYDDDVDKEELRLTAVEVAARLPDAVRISSLTHDGIPQLQLAIIHLLRAKAQRPQLLQIQPVVHLPDQVVPKLQVTDTAPVVTFFSL